MNLPASLTRATFVLMMAAVPGQSAAQPTDGRLVDWTVRMPGVGNRVLGGTLTLPRTGTPPYPVALTLTGSGAHHRDGNRTASDPYRPFAQIAVALGSRGIATLRLDDRGVGASTGDAVLTDGDDVADDARAAIAWLGRQAMIDGDRIAVIGHSFGGVVAPLVAIRDSSVAAVVLMGAPARSFRKTMRYQLAYTIGRDARIAPERQGAALDSALRIQDRNARGGAQRWRRWFQDYDPLSAARGVRCPVLILHGLTDRAVPRTDALLLRDAIRANGNSSVTVRLFDNLNHHFLHDTVGAREGYDALPSQTLAPEFLDAMSSWLASILSS